MKDETGKRVQASVFVDKRLHVALMELAAAKTASEGRKVGLKELVERAVLKAYPEMQDALAGVLLAPKGAKKTDSSGSGSGSVASKPQQQQLAEAPTAATGESEEILGRLFGAVFQPTLAESNRAIEQLAGYVLGCFDQKIPLKQLAYRLRSDLERGAAIETLDDLVCSYEDGD